MSCSMHNIKSDHFLFYFYRKNRPPSGDHGQVKEALVPEGGDRLRMERASIRKLKDKLESGDWQLGDEVNKQGNIRVSHCLL